MKDALSFFSLENLQYYPCLESTSEHWVIVMDLCGIKLLPMDVWVRAVVKPLTVVSLSKTSATVVEKRCQ